MSRIASRILVLSLLLVAASAPAASAHEEGIGSGGPFRVEVTESGLPADVELRLGNGELEMHVPAGIEVVAIGYENEPFAKIDAEGNMFGNQNSPTWWMGLDGGNSSAPPGLDPESEPDWKWVKGGGSFQYHDHRIHFMAASISPELAEGGEVFDFVLPFEVKTSGADDFVPVEVAGTLVFDPSIDPAAAQMLISGQGGTVLEDSSDSSPVLVLAVAAAAVAAIGAGFALKKRNRKQRKG